MTSAFSKIWIIGILTVVLAGGVFAWQARKKIGVFLPKIAKNQNLKI